MPIGALEVSWRFPGAARAKRVLLCLKLLKGAKGAGATGKAGVILKPSQGGPIDAKCFPENHENLRGMVA